MTEALNGIVLVIGRGVGGYQAAFAEEPACGATGQ
jgi:hypothetical protein